MSNSNLFLTSKFLRAPLQNGLGRYVCQLQRVTLKFCKSSGNSRGMREFLEYDLVDFAKENPGIVVYVKPRRHRTANLSAEFLNGEKHVINCRNYTREEIKKWINLLKTENGDSTDTRLRKLWHTQYPSIQGPWTPFTHKDPSLNLIEYPNKQVGSAITYGPTATEKLIELFKQQRMNKESSLEEHRAE